MSEWSVHGQGDFLEAVRPVVMSAGVARQRRVQRRCRTFLAAVMDGVSSGMKGSCALGLLERDLRDQAGEARRWASPKRMFLFYVHVESPAESF